MSSFFEPPPPPPEEGFAAYPQPPWIAAPRDVLGTPVALRLILGRTGDAVVAITDATAYPSGVELGVGIRRRTFDPHDPALLHDPFSLHGRPPAGPLPPELLRLGVQFADGRKVTTLDLPRTFAAAPDSEPGGPTFVPGGGGGGDGTWDWRFWLWPLPPPGPLAFVCEWPAEGIELTRVEVDAELLLAAAADAEPLWP